MHLNDNYDALQFYVENCEGLFWLKLSSLLSLSYLFCLLNPNQEASQGTQRQHKKGRGVTQSQVSSVCLRMLMSEAGRTWRGSPAGQQSALNWPAVLCSFCSLKACWAARLCQKEGKVTALLDCTQWQRLLLRGVPFRGGQQAPG